MINRVFIIPFFVSLIGFVLLVSMDSVIKILGDRYPILQLLFLNALFSLIPLAYFIFKNHGFKFYKNQNLEYNYGIWKLDKLLNKKISKEVSNRLPEELKNMTWKNLIVEIIEIFLIFLFPSTSLLNSANESLE